MSQAARALLWSAIGTFLSLYVLNVWSLSQGGPGLPNVVLYDGRPIAGAYTAVLVSGVALSILCLVGIRHALSVGDAPWTERLPVVGLGEGAAFDFRSWEIRAYQAAFLAAFVLLPSAGLYHLGDKVLDDGLVWNTTLSPNSPILVRNTIPFLARTDRDGDREEAACASAVLRAGGGSPDVRLVERRCDALKERSAPPYTDAKAISSGNSPVKEDGPMTVAKACVTAISERATAGSCGGPRDVSHVCDKDVILCGGVSWDPVISPLAMIAAMAAGWTSAAFLLAVVFIPRRGAAARIGMAGGDGQSATPSPQAPPASPPTP